jgi:hypothetical protein
MSRAAPARKREPPPQRRKTSDSPRALPAPLLVAVWWISFLLAAQLICVAALVTSRAALRKQVFSSCPEQPHARDIVCIHMAKKPAAIDEGSLLVVVRTRSEIAERWRLGDAGVKRRPSAPAAARRRLSRPTVRRRLTATTVSASSPTKPAPSIAGLP